MVRFYCPGCWSDFGKDFDQCPKCGLHIHEFWASKDYVERLILALNHPEKSTPVRAAWILGKLKDPRAVEALIRLIETSEDIYLIVAAVKALGEIRTVEALAALETLRKHPARMVKEAARWALDRNTVEPSPRKDMGAAS
jgi:HEAT repeat protein